MDRRALPAPAAAQADEAYAAPRTPLEAKLADIWSAVLRRDQLGIYDSFFDLGGHSLLATQLVSRVRSALGTELPLRALFEAPTVAGLAARISAAGAADQDAMPPPGRAPRERALPLSFAQQRLWVVEQWNPGTALYNVPCILQLRGKLDRSALQRALEELVRRHEILRTRYLLHNGEPVQVISPDTDFPLAEVDLSGLPEGEREEKARQVCREEADRPFDLERDRMIRGTTVQLAEEEHLLVLTLHHIASDGWSSFILRHELSALYEAFREGRPSPLPELPIQYADYAVWQRKWLQGAPLERQIAYWKSQLAEAPPVMELPTDRPRELARTHRGGLERQLIGSDVQQALNEIGRSERASLFMVLLAAFNVLLYRYTGQEDLVVGTDEAGRGHETLEGLLGFFVNHLVLRTDLSGNPSFRELLRRVRTMTLDAYSHRDLPFDRLVEELRPDRQASHTPLFQVLFVMQNAGSGGASENAFRFSTLSGGVRSSKYDIGLFLTEGRAALGASWVYRSDLFDASTIRTMAGDFEAVLRAASASPEITVAELRSLLFTRAGERAEIEVEERRSANRARLRSGLAGTRRGA